MGTLTSQFQTGGWVNDSPTEAAVRVQHMPFEILLQFARSGFLFAIIDATGEPAVPDKLWKLDPGPAISLYEGTEYADHWAIAPYLASVDESLLMWMKDQFPIEPWGIFLVSREPFAAIFQNYQRYLVVTLADGQNWFFRFYDPRVLEKHLMRASKDEVTLFFGPVRSIVTATWKEYDAKAFLIA